MNLRELYEAAHYRVLLPGAPFTLRIGQTSMALRALHERHGVTQSCFITACNPRSQPAGDAANAAAHHRLVERAQQAGWPRIDGVGHDPAGRWPDEPALLLLGVGAHCALRLCREFDQGAVVVAGQSAVPALLWAQATAPAS